MENIMESTTTTATATTTRPRSLPFGEYHIVKGYMPGVSLSRVRSVWESMSPEKQLEVATAGVGYCLKMRLRYSVPGESIPADILRECGKTTLFAPSPLPLSRSIADTSPNVYRIVKLYRESWEDLVQETFVGVLEALSGEDESRFTRGGRVLSLRQIVCRESRRASRRFIRQTLRHPSATWEKTVSLPHGGTERVLVADVHGVQRERDTRNAENREIVREMLPEILEYTPTSRRDVCAILAERRGAGYTDKETTETFSLATRTVRRASKDLKNALHAYREQERMAEEHDREDAYWEGVQRNHDIKTGRRSPAPAPAVSVEETGSTTAPATHWGESSREYMERIDRECSRRFYADTHTKTGRIRKPRNK